MRTWLVAVSVIAALLAVGLIVCFVVYRPTFLHLRQVGVLADLQVYARSLETYRTDHGHYPAHLAEGTADIEWFSPLDRWGYPLLYLSDGDTFVLVSMGKGGHPDGENYIALRRQAPRGYDWEECSDPAVDQIVTDKGWYRGCGK